MSARDIVRHELLTLKATLLVRCEGNGLSFHLEHATEHQPQVVALSDHAAASLLELERQRTPDSLAANLAAVTAMLAELRAQKGN